MKVRKDRQFLVFDFEDGNTVKYDFATKTCIGKKGAPVTNLKTQLRGMSIKELIDCCEDSKYANFLRFIKHKEQNKGRYISNIGTILETVPLYNNFEQIFSAGIEDIIDDRYGDRFTATISEIPKGLIRLCKDHKIKISNNFLKYYKQNPDAYLLAYNLEYVSLTDANIFEILSHQKYVSYYVGYNSVFNTLLNDYGYTAKALLKYIDYLKTYEAIDNMSNLLTEICDYASMMQEISTKFDKYPRHFLTTHKIASRNYNRLKVKFEEEKFKNRINKDMEKNFDEFCFIYPDSTQDIKDEATQQNNCVASYIQRVINGECHILFLRKREDPDKSLVTIEVRNNKIVQALQRFNNPLTEKQKEAVDKWNKWWANKIESEELKDAG